MDHTSFRRVQYLVCTRAEIEGAKAQGRALSGCETYQVLAEAQKRIRDLGPTYGIKAIRHT